MPGSDLRSDPVPCGHRLSPVVTRRRIPLEEGDDGLSEAWSGRLAYVNPPFSALLAWRHRAHDQWSSGDVQTVICLIPVHTDPAWFHEVLSTDADPTCSEDACASLILKEVASPPLFSLKVLTLGVNTDQR